MSDEKKKVKDLASALGLQNKDVIAAAKDLGIVAAKVAGSSLSDAEAARLRNHFVPAEEKTEVIVRRRRKAAGEPEGDAAEAPSVKTSATPTEAAPLAVSGDASSDTSSGGSSDAPAGKKKPAAARVVPSTAVTEEASVPVASKPEGAKVVRAATVITPAAQVEPVSAKPAQTEPEVAVKEKPVKTVAAKEPQEKAAKTTEESKSAPVARVVEAPAEPATEAKKNVARVVRPAAFSAEPERNAAGQAVSSAPALPPKSEQSGDFSTSSPDGGDDSGANRTSQVRVISRPDPHQPRDRDAGQRPAQGDRPQGDRPGGYAPRPQGDRPGGYAPRPQGDRPGGYAPRPQGDRPGGYAPRPQGDRPGGYAPRPQGDRPGGGYPPRPGGAPGGFAPRPGAPGPDRGDRPSAPPRPGGAPGGFNRPGGTGAQPFGGLGGAPDSEQGRKKRQKGRRTVDFTGGDSRRGMDADDVGWSKNSRRKGRGKRDVAPMGGTQPVKAVKRKIKVDEFIRVSDLAHQMALKSGEIIKVLFNLGIMATINQSLDIDTATLVAGEFDYEIEKVGFSEADVLVAQQEVDAPEDMVTRPPVVTIMGHVDHGKTSLLDAIRKSSVVTGEAGGITQHIGAYHVTTKKGEIVFLDTPGHEAFTAMRARGAEVTDIVVLVVAADDGVMEQTKEAINHAKAAGVPIMVAVNKMDKPEANPERVKRELADQGLVAEDWGGTTTFSYVSAKTRDGLDELLELLALQAEILELKANPKRAAMGHIVEAKLDKGRGSLGTVLIQQGTLRLGDTFVCGVHVGRVRAMFDDQGKKVKEAGPSMPVEVQGFEGVPEAGEEFICLTDEKGARRIAEARALKQRERALAKESKITLETFLARKADSVEAEVLNLVVKSDVQGSLEAITDALRKLSTEKVRINVIHGGTGAISESDVLLASASTAIIIGFNVRPTVKAKELAEQEKVDTRFYDIIYKLVEEIKSAMQGMLAPVSREVFLGTADVRETFSVPKAGLVAGCHVSDGKIIRNSPARLLRDGIVVHTGKIGSLRRFKDDVREVAKGYECGISFDNYNDVKVGDVIEAYEIVEEAAVL